MQAGTENRGHWSRRAVPIALIAVAAVAGFLLLGDTLSYDALARHHLALEAFRDRNYPLAILAFATLYAAAVALSLPGGLALTLAGGYLFGTAVAAALVVPAATAGAVVLFLAARSGIGDHLHARLVARAGDTGLLARLERGLRANEWSVLMLMRLVPVIPFFVANLAPAFLGVSLRTYAVTTFLGIIPGTVVFASVGAGLGTLLAAGARPDTGVIFSWPVLLPLLGLCALSALPIVVRALRGRDPI
jgi:uncharacterized membrane protein YdjX (TVP38/TMEM64 family)